MKTLINKQNPQIRITAPEIRSYRESDREFYVLPNADFHRLFKMENWTLVEEEPVKEEICSKCIHHKKNDDCYYPCGGMKRRINENGVYECTGFCEKEQEQPKRKQSPALKKIVDNLAEEKLAKTRAEMKTVEEEPEYYQHFDPNC